MATKWHVRYFYAVPNYLIPQICLVATKFHNCYLFRNYCAAKQATLLKCYWKSLRHFMDISLGVNPLVMRLWDEWAPPALHSLYFGYALGSVIAAEMTRPFLSKLQPTNLTMREVDSIKFNNHSENLLRHTSGLVSPSRLVYPYTISGGLAILIGCLLTAIHIRGPPMGFPTRQPQDNLRLAPSLRSCSIGKECYGAIILVLCFFYFLFTQGGEQSIDSYLFSYAVDAEVSFSKDEAAHLVTVFYVCYMTGRFLSIFISSLFPIHYLIFGSILGVMVTMVCAAMLAFSSSLALWCIAGFAGLFMSTLYPSGMAWINVYMKVFTLNSDLNNPIRPLVNYCRPHLKFCALGCI